MVKSRSLTHGLTWLGWWVRQRVRSSGSSGRLCIKMPSLRSSSLTLDRPSRSHPLQRSSSDAFQEATGGTTADRTGTHGHRSSCSADDLRQLAAANQARQAALQAPRSPRRPLHASRSSPNVSVPGSTGSNPAARTPVPRLNLAAVSGASIAPGGFKGAGTLLTPPVEARKPRLSRRLFNPVDTDSFSALEVGDNEEDARVSFHTARGSPAELDGPDSEPAAEPDPGSSGSEREAERFDYLSSEEGDTTSDEGFEVDRLWNEHRAAMAADSWRRRSGQPARGSPGGTGAVPAGGAVPPADLRDPLRHRQRPEGKLMATDSGVAVGGPSPFATVSLFHSSEGRGGSSSDPTRFSADVARQPTSGGTGPSRAQKAAARAGGLAHQPPEDSAIQMHGASMGGLPQPSKQPVQYEGRNLESDFEQAVATHSRPVAVDKFPPQGAPLRGSVTVVAPVATNPAPANLASIARLREGSVERAAGDDLPHRQQYQASAFAEDKGLRASTIGAGPWPSRAEQVGGGGEQRLPARPAEMAAAAARALLHQGPTRSHDARDDASRGTAYSDDGTVRLAAPPPSPSDSLQPPPWPPSLPYPPYGHHPVHAYSSLYYPYHAPYPPVPPELLPYYHRAPPGYPVPPQGSPESLRHAAGSIMRTRPLSPSIDDELGSLSRERRMSLGSRVSGEWVRSVVHEAERAAAIAERAAAAANEALQRAQQVQEAPPAPAPAKVVRSLLFAYDLIKRSLDLHHCLESLQTPPTIPFCLCACWT